VAAGAAAAGARLLRGGPDRLGALPRGPVPLAGLNDLLENLPLVCRLASADARESLTAWLELWTFIDEEGRTRTLAESLWEGQRRFLEALVSEGHVLSIKSRKVGLSTLVCAHAAWTARIRDVYASVDLLSYREDAARELCAVFAAASMACRRSCACRSRARPRACSATRPALLMRAL
jgi:hypothetical protein